MIICSSPLIQILAQVQASSIYRIDTINPRYFITIVPLIIFLVIIIARISFRPFITRYTLTVSLLIAMIVCNFVFGNSHMRFAKKEYRSFYKAANALSALPASSIIGVDYTGRWQMASHLILTKRIIPPEHCQDYRIQGRFRYQRIAFVPRCLNNVGHIYVPSPFEGALKPDYVLAFKVPRPPRFGNRTLSQIYSDYSVAYDTQDFMLFQRKHETHSFLKK